MHSRVGIQASETSTGVTEEPLIFEAAKEEEAELTDRFGIATLNRRSCSPKTENTKYDLRKKVGKQ